MGVIISGFPGVGKTTLGEKYHNIIDLESSDFKSIYTKDVTEDKEKRKGITDKVENPEWHMNYVNEAIEHCNYFDIVLVSNNTKVKQLIRERGHKVIAFYPSLNDKDLMIKRYINRGNKYGFINHIDKHYEEYINMVKAEIDSYELEGGEYLEDRLIKMGIL